MKNFILALCLAFSVTSYGQVVDTITYTSWKGHTETYVVTYQLRHKVYPPYTQVNKVWVITEKRKINENH